jgi:alginate O-acetyltransferase complex protein AlgI
MSDAPFAHPRDATKSDAYLFVRGHIAALSGIALMLTLALVSRQIGDRTLGLIGILPFFLLIHFGYADMLTSTLRLARHPVGVLFDQPWKSTSLRDFWSNRWNRPFVEMNRALFFRGAASRFGRTAGLLIAFLVSGFLHELGISYPAGGGWGLPTMYFMIQGVLLVLEEKRLVPTSRLWVWLTVLLPLPLLFHEPFQNALVVPFYRQLGIILLSYSPEEYLGWLIPIAGSAHAIVLIAGTQVPAKLGWKTDLAKLTPFNRKIVWNYGAFIFLLILAFGLETLIFHEEMVRGEPAAIGMASLICAFWLLRLLVDCFYFSHSDWPEGAEFIVGHTLLNSLFLFLVLSYGTLLAWHCWRPVPL